MTAEEYRKMLDTDFSDVELEELTDISGIQIDRNLPLEERKQQYLKKVGNPYPVSYTHLTLTTIKHRCRSRLSADH